MQQRATHPAWLGAKGSVVLVMAAAALLTACDGDLFGRAATTVETQPSEQPADEQPEPDAQAEPAVQVDLDGAESVGRRWTSSAGGFSLDLAWVHTDALGEVGSRVATPGLYFAALEVEVVNPLGDRAAPGVADHIALQVALAEGPQGCPSEATGGLSEEGDRWCLLPSTTEPPLSGDLSAGESRMVQVITDEPLSGSDIVTDRIAVAVADGANTVLLTHEPIFDPPTTGGDETIRGALQVEEGSVEGVRILVLAEGRRLVGEVETDADGQWEVVTGRDGDYQVLLDPRTLPDGVELREPARSELDVAVLEGQQRTVLFPLQ